LRSLTINQVDKNGKELATVDFKVYSSVSNMRRGIRRYMEYIDAPSRKCDNGVEDTAWAMSLFLNPNSNKTPRTAIVFFNLEHIGGGIVAHELTHILLWIEDENLKKLAKCKIWSVKESSLHEEIASTMEQHTKLFWTWWYDKKKKNSHG